MTGSNAVNLTCPLIGTEEKQFVLLDRSSQREPKLVFLEDRAPLVCSVQKEIISVEILIAEELENRPVEIVAARSGNQSDVGTAIAPICCIVESCLDLELPYAVRVGNRKSATPPALPCTSLMLIPSNWKLLS